MTSYFIIDFTASKNCGVNNKRYSLMTFADTLVTLNDIILNLSKSYIETDKFERVFVKVWKWEDEKAAYMFQGVIYDYDTKTIYI